MYVNKPRTLLGDLSAEQFLTRYWQKQPLLIRGAFPDYASPITPDELAGLACEEGVEARLVEEHAAQKPWQVTHGPFDEAVFATLPEHGWTLLVQAVDHYLPELTELLEHFHFLPRWRLDDVMVSYAPPGGSVGPHVDQYDVFLLQASGTRRWQLGGKVDANAATIQGIDLRILEHFEVQPDQDWLLEPGDMLYLPPAIAHHGLSQSDDCMTFSVGFRALSADESITSFADFVGEQLSDFQRYADAGLTPALHPGEIDAAALQRMRALILDTLDNPEQLAQWFGRAMTQPKYLDQLIAAEPPTDKEALVAALEEGQCLERSLGSRFAYHTHATTTTLFIDGDGQTCDHELALLLSGDEPLDERCLRLPGAAELLTRLVDRGSLSWPYQDDSEDDQISHDD